MFNDELFCKIFILRCPGVGPVKYANLLKQFGDVFTVADSLRENIDVYDSVKREIDIANKLKIQFIDDNNGFYPDNLKKIKAHPPVISVRGNISTLNNECIGMVGTRHASVNGMNFMCDLAQKIVENNMVVVSGLAIGTDAASHRGALNVKGEKQTIAVLAGGVDYIWPLENENLYWEIVERGAIVSEMPIGFIPKITNFIQRNRWIAGLANKFILGEADLKSGSMATARFAIDYGRDVWAVPSHPSDERSKGPNSLISQGKAKLCMGIEDFMENKVQKDEVKKKENLSDLESKILDSLGVVPVSESVLAEIVKENISDIKMALVMLELSGKVQKQDNGYIRL